MGATKLEPVVVAVGSTRLSDALALLVLAACVSAFAGGFSWAQLTLQALDIVLFVPLLLLGLAWLAERLLRATGDDEKIQSYCCCWLWLWRRCWRRPSICPTSSAPSSPWLAVNAAARGRSAEGRTSGS